MTPVDVWLWYCRALAAREAGAVAGLGRGLAYTPRGWELSDVVTPIVRHARRGRLTEAHLRVLRRYGAEQREPVADHAQEAGDAALWGEALDLLAADWRRKGMLA